MCLNQCEANKAYRSERVKGPRMENWELKISFHSTGRHKHSWKVNIRICGGETGCKAVDS